MIRLLRRGRGPARGIINLLIALAFLIAALYGLDRTDTVEIEPGPVRVIDGDSIERAKVKIRLHGIDAPERRQTCRDARERDWPCGQEATAALKRLIGGRDAACRSIERDRYGRSVADCRIGALDLNGEMVRQGWAVAYRKHSMAYVAEEDEARRAKRGLWRGRFETPEAYRARQRLTRGDAAGLEESDED